MIKLGAEDLLLATRLMWPVDIARLFICLKYFKDGDMVMLSGADCKFYYSDKTITVQRIDMVGLRTRGPFKVDMLGKFWGGGLNYATLHTYGVFLNGNLHWFVADSKSCFDHET
ncbi:hypothetical protein ACP275_01G102200 [Erythranthe tilingii]